MVYEKKCAECGDIIDFGGEEKEDLPEGAIEFDGSVYCRDCVKEFVEFGTGEIVDRVDFLEERLKEIMENIGMEKHLEDLQSSG